MVIILQISFHKDGLTNDKKKYVILKIDDVGNSLGLNRWKYFFELILTNNNYYVDLGIIPHYYRRIISEKEINYLKQLLNTHRVALFNHGWDHIAPEFDDSKSFEYIDEHLKKWDEFMSTNFQNGYSNVRVLGAPGNTFGQLPNSSIYKALELNNYSALFFSNESGNSDDGRAGLDLEYVKAEIIVSGKLKMRNVDEVIEAINLTNARAVVLQLHPSHHAWNSKLLKNLFDRIYNETGREGINVDNYLINHFLPGHPNYFLRGQSISSALQKNRKLYSISPIQNSLKSKISYFISSILYSLKYNQYSFQLKSRFGHKSKTIISLGLITLIFTLLTAYLTFKYYSK